MNSIKKIVMTLFMLSATTQISAGFDAFSTLYLGVNNAFSVLELGARWAQIFVELRKGYQYLISDKSPVTQTKSYSKLKSYADVPQKITDLVNSVKNGELKKDTGIMLWGEPGTGKTFLADCIAGEFDCPYFKTNASVFNNPNDGGGEAQLRGLFADARSAANKHGFAVIFIDEFDAFEKRTTTTDETIDNNSKKTGKITALLNLLDGKSNSEIAKDTMATDAVALRADRQVIQIENNDNNNGFWIKLMTLKRFASTLSFSSFSKKGTVLLKAFLDGIRSYIPILNSTRQTGHIIVIGATNHINKIDKAILRDGRFDHKIEIMLPDEDKRENIVKKHLQCHQAHFNDLNNYDDMAKKIAKLTGGWSAVELEGIVFKASKNTGENSSDKFASVILAHDKMKPERPATKREKQEIANEYTKKAEFKGDINYTDLLCYTENMPIGWVKNIFEKAKLHAKNNGQAFVSIDHCTRASVEVENVFKQHQQEHSKKILKVLTTLYPDNNNITLQLFTTHKDKTTKQLLDIISNNNNERK